MERKYYKELWSLRFKKMLELEEHGVTAYQAMLDEARKKSKGHPIEAHLERLVTDEKRHVTLVADLIKILEGEP